MLTWHFNEIWFLSQALVTFSIILLCFRLGKSWLMGYIGICAVLMNIVVVKQVTLFGFDATLGNILYASIFLVTDILSEHYGIKEAFKAVRIGFFAGIFSMITLQFALRYIPNEYDFAQSSFITIFTLTPRIILASLASYLITQNWDVWMYHKLRHATSGRHLWLRNNFSTITSQLFDSFLFSYIAFYGVFDSINQMAIFTFLIKFIIALIDTPFIYLTKLKFFEPENIRKKEFSWWGKTITKLAGEE